MYDSEFFWSQKVPGKLGECTFSHENLKSQTKKAGPRPHAFITWLSLYDYLTMSANSEL